MGMMDKMKFWEKKDDSSDDLGDFSDLGDFGLDDSGPGSPGPGPGSDQTAGLSGTGDIGSPIGPPEGSGPEVPGAGPGPQREELQPTPGSRQMGEDLGLTSREGQQAAPVSAPARSAPAQPDYQQQYQAPPQQAPAFLAGGPDISDIAKELQILQAKMDAVRASIDSINRRLENLERIAEGGRKTGW